MVEIFIHFFQGGPVLQCQECGAAVPTLGFLLQKIKIGANSGAAILLISALRAPYFFEF